MRGLSALQAAGLTARLPTPFQPIIGDTDMNSANRRAFLSAGTVALATGAVPQVSLGATTNPDPDAELMRLGDQWRAAKAAETEAWAAYEAADDRLEAMAPEFPAVLRVRGFDIGEGLAPSTHRLFTPDELQNVERTYAERVKRPQTRWHQKVIDRCAELIAAIPAYYSALETAREASGFRGADGRHADAICRAQALEERLADLPAHTLQGVRLKAQLALSVADPDETYESRIFLAVFRQLAELG